MKIKILIIIFSFTFFSFKNETKFNNVIFVYDLDFIDIPEKFISSQQKERYFNYENGVLNKYITNNEVNIISRNYELKYILNSYVKSGNMKYMEFFLGENLSSYEYYKIIYFMNNKYNIKVEDEYSIYSHENLKKLILLTYFIPIDSSHLIKDYKIAKDYILNNKKFEYLENNLKNNLSQAIDFLYNYKKKKFKNFEVENELITFLEKNKLVDNQLNLTTTINKLKTKNEICCSKLTQKLKEKLYNDLKTNKNKFYFIPSYIYDFSSDHINEPSVRDKIVNENLCEILVIQIKNKIYDSQLKKEKDKIKNPEMNDSIMFNCFEKFYYYK